MGALFRWALHPGLIVAIVASLWVLADAQRPAEKCSIYDRASNNPYGHDPYRVAPPDDADAEEPALDDHKTEDPRDDTPAHVNVGVDFDVDASGF